MADRIIAYGPITLASIAGHLAETLYRFVDELPETAREVRGIISVLFEVRTFFRELDLGFQDARFQRLNLGLLADIALGVGSCSSSLHDLDGIVLRCSMTRRGSSPRSARKSWTEILSSFRNIEGSSVQTRFDIHRSFLFTVTQLLRNMYFPSRTKRNDQKAEVMRLQEQIRNFASQQEKISARMRAMEALHRRTMEEQAYYTRVQMPASPPAPPYNSPPRRSYSTPLPSPPFQPPVDSYRYFPNTIHESRPMTPGSPASPISPISPLTSSPPMTAKRYSATPAPQMMGIGLNTPPSTPPTARPKSRVGNPQLPSKATDQWWSHVFGLNPGSTTLSEPPKQSECHGLPMENLNMAPEDHEIFRVEFDSDLMLRMFRNDATEEAKVVVTIGGNGGSWSSGGRNGYRFQTCIDASLLNVSRIGPGIHLMRRNLVWACLYFADFETLTLFYHAFLALRFRAPSAPVAKESEYWLDGESLMFSAKINDHGYTHALRLLKDRESGCIRLAAAKADGEQDVTVWTAFITNQIASPGWLHFNRSRTVSVRNIRQFSFSSCFETNLWRDFNLRFLQAADAQAFTQVIDTEFRKMSVLKTGEHRRTPGPMTHREGYY